jgi:hypothetical protein
VIEVKEMFANPTIKTITPRVINDIPLHMFAIRSVDFNLDVLHDVTVERRAPVSGGGGGALPTGGAPFVSIYSVLLISLVF